MIIVEEVLRHEISYGEFKKYPGLEQLSTPELEELLRQDFATSEDDEASMVFLTEIMEVIHSREAQIPSPVDENTAWETFLSRNVTPAVTPDSSPPQSQSAQPRQKLSRFPKKRTEAPPEIAVVSFLCRRPLFGGLLFSSFR